MPRRLVLVLLMLVAARPSFADTAAPAADAAAPCDDACASGDASGYPPIACQEGVATCPHDNCGGECIKGCATGAPTPAPLGRQVGRLVLVLVIGGAWLALRRARRRQSARSSSTTKESGRAPAQLYHS